jgi:uncharacterized protein
MRARALAHAIDIDRVDLEALDKFLMSDRSPPDCMMLSELDGFLTGIAIGPGLVLPSEWLPLVWGGDAPAFADLDEAKEILGYIMARYNEILREVADHVLAPIFWVDTKGTCIAADWVEGFLEAIKLRPDEWESLFTCKRDGKLLFPILSFCCDENGHSLIGLPPEATDHMVAQAQELIPPCVMGIAAYWRRKGATLFSMPFETGPRSVPDRAGKVGRNDPCPCGSGRKFKRCCGQSA